MRIELPQLPKFPPSPPENIRLPGPSGQGPAGDICFLIRLARSKIRETTNDLIVTASPSAADKKYLRKRKHAADKLVADKQ